MAQPDSEPEFPMPATSKAEPQQEELAEVIAAGQTRYEASRPWYVTLRPALFCLMFLLMAECAARLYFDTTLCLETERFDNFPGPGTQAAFIAQMQRDKAYKIVLIGDSTIVGPSLLPKNETMPRILEAELNHRVPNRRIHVWNMSIAGARSTDELCLLKKAIEGKPDFIAVEGNYFISEQIFDANVPLHAEWVMNPWLAYNLPEVPPSLLPLLPPRNWKQCVEDSLTVAIETHVRLVGMRQAINAMLFGVQPRTPFETPNPLIMAGVSIAKKTHRLYAQSWSQKGISAGSYVSKFCQPITPDNFNGQHYREVMLELQRVGTPALTYLTPQNPGITKVVLTPEEYGAGRTVLSSFFQGYGVPYYDFSELVPDPFFVDNDHLTAEGNRRLAVALANEIAPRIQNQQRDPVGSVGALKTRSAQASMPRTY
jgi:hypothetical protein